MRLSSYLVWVGCFLVAVLPTRTAEACSCGSSNSVLSPLPGALHAPDLPLVYYSNNSELTLADEAGNPFELGLARDADGHGLCSGSYRFVVPTPPLESGGDYVLTPDPLGGEGAEWASEHTVRFRTAKEPSRTTAVELSLEAILEAHEPWVSDGAGCGDPLLDDRVLSKSASVHLAAIPPLLLFVSVTVNDPLAGPIVNSNQSVRLEDDATHAAVGIPVPDEASACLDVQVFDASGAEVHRQELCPEPGAPVTATSEVRAIALELPLPGESEPDGGAGQAERVETTGWGCRTSKRPVGPRSAIPFVGLLGLAFLRRRRARPDPCVR